jgi:hypothetical protein
MRNTGMTHIESVFIYKECGAWHLWCQSLVFFNYCFIGLCLTRGREAEYWICRCLEEAGTCIWELLISSCMKSWWLSMTCRQLVPNLTWSRCSVTQCCVVWCPAYVFLPVTRRSLPGQSDIQIFATPCGTVSRFLRSTTIFTEIYMQTHVGLTWKTPP